MRRRSFRQILELPQTDQEERIAARHIRRECSKIRRTWSRLERSKRGGYQAGPWAPPTIATADLSDQRTDR